MTRVRPLLTATVAALCILAANACSDEEIIAFLAEFRIDSPFTPGEVTVNDARAWGGITLFKHAGENKLVAFDMDGTPLRTWSVAETSAFPRIDWAKPIDGGQMLVYFGEYEPMPPDIFPPHRLLYTDIHADVLGGWEGGPGLERMHHDMQLLANGNFLILVSPPNTFFPDISETIVHDDVIIEVTPEGDVVWSWSTGAHYSQLPLTMDERDTLAAQTWVDIFHTNSVQVLPPNTYNLETYPQFTPGNIIVSQRATNDVIIIDRETGNVVWSLDPDTVGHRRQHHATMIPMGYPGAGNILVFDNGCCGPGLDVTRNYSRIVEVDPTDQSVVWEYDGSMTDGGSTGDFYTPWGGSVQRLPNGNTVITSSAQGRIFEVENDTFDVVWDFTIESEGNTGIYRSYRVSRNWLNGAGTAMGNPFPW